jgi:hypothetical protein
MAIQYATPADIELMNANAAHIAARLQEAGIPCTVETAHVNVDAGIWINEAVCVRVGMEDADATKQEDDAFDRTPTRNIGNVADLIEDVKSLL